MQKYRGKIKNSHEDTKAQKNIATESTENTEKDKNM